MYKYSFNPDEDIKILTSFDMESAKKQVIPFTDCICYRSRYPNGFIIEIFQYTDKTIVQSNMELIENGDGTLDVLI